jgi:hypothetical protein
VDQSELDRLGRPELIQRAQRLGVERAELMTRVELRDEIVRLSESDAGKRKRARGWLGVARDLLASVVDKRLHLPEAAALIRGEIGLDFAAKPHGPVATVTLAEIYAAQGHVARAVELLDEVHVREPDHEPARELSDRLKTELARRAEAAAQRAEQRNLASALGRTPFGVPSSDALPEPVEPAPDSAEQALEPAEPAHESAKQPLEAAEPPAEPDSLAAEPEAAELDAAHAELDRGWEPEPEPLHAGAAEAAASPAHPPLRAAARDASSDLLVAIPRGPSGSFVYWELRPETVERARRREPGGRLSLCVVALEPCWDGARLSERELDVEPLVGSALLDGLPEASVVRLALGWRSESGFRPLEVGLVLDDDAREVKWSPPGRADRKQPLALARDRVLERLHAR